MASNAPYGVGPINRQSVGASLQGSDENTLNQILQDRNIQQFLAQLGATVGGKGSAGQAIGAPTSQLIQREALAEALAKGSNVTLGADGSMKIQQQTGSGGGAERETRSGDNVTGTQNQDQQTSGYDLSQESGESLLDRLTKMTFGEE